MLLGQRWTLAIPQTKPGERRPTGGLAKLRPRGAYRGHVAASTSLPPPPPANEPPCAMLRWEYGLTLFFFFFGWGGGGHDSSREPACLQGGTLSCPAPLATMSNMIAAWRLPELLRTSDTTAIAFQKQQQKQKIHLLLHPASAGGGLFLPYAPEL